ncbi:hypothetical protein GCM10010424_61250 [Streptomyces lienomycini]
MRTPSSRSPAAIVPRVTSGPVGGGVGMRGSVPDAVPERQRIAPCPIDRRSFPQVTLGMPK